METIRTLIADDEPVALRGMRRLLTSDPEIVIVGEARTGGEAVHLIETEQPELLFLDIQMPDLDGLKCVARLPPGQRPVTIFVTAFEDYAIAAFEVEALDYLLKPFSDDRFFAAVERAKKHVQSRRLRAVGSRFAALLTGDHGETPAADFATGPINSPPAYLARILIRSRDHMTFVEAEEIDWIEAADYQAELHVAGRTHVVRHSLAELETRLDPSIFVRVHRSAIVNLRSIREIHPFFNGQFILVLRDGSRVTVSRRRRADLERALGQKL